MSACDCLFIHPPPQIWVTFDHRISRIRKLASHFRRTLGNSFQGLPNSIHYFVLHWKLWLIVYELFPTAIRVAVGNCCSQGLLTVGRQVEITLGLCITRPSQFRCNSSKIHRCHDLMIPKKHSIISHIRVWVDSFSPYLPLTFTIMNYAAWQIITCWCLLGLIKVGIIIVCTFAKQGRCCFVLNEVDFATKVTGGINRTEWIG